MILYGMLGIAAGSIIGGAIGYIGKRSGNG
jgi:hypothetical protein